MLRIGRTYELRAKQFADSTRASVAGDHVVRALQTRAVWRRNLQIDPACVLFKASNSVIEQRANIVETGQAIEQHFFEFRLIEGAQRRVTKLASDREIRGHQCDIARIEVADMRILNEAWRDPVEQADLGEQTQCLGVISNCSRQS